MRILKVTAISFLVISLFFILMLLAVAFVKAEFNPFLWGETARAGVIWFTACVSLFVPLGVDYFLEK